MKKDLNLLTSYKEIKKAQRMWSKSTKRNVILVFLIVAFSVGTMVYLNGENQRLLAAIEQELMFIEDPVVINKITEVNQKDQELELWEKLYLEVETLKTTTQQYPSFNSQLIELLERSECSLVTISYNRAVVSMELTCAKADQPSAYIRQLEESGMFSSISYHGYVYDASKKKYSFSVTAQIEEGGNQQ